MRAPTKLITAVATLALLLVAPAAAQAYWGAIAVDPTTGKVGYSRLEPTAKRAKVEALDDCAENHCKVAVWVSNGYGAVVKKKSGIYIAGFGRTKNLAFRDARDRAHEQSAAPVAWVFSGFS
jgi:hypothetical protein